MTPEERLFTMLSNQSALLGRPLKRNEWLATTKGFLATLAKDRKKSAIDDRAQAVLNVYPRREGGTASLVAISKAIATDGFELVLDKTTEYASAVARWPHNRRKSASGSSLVPLPSTFYGNRRYLDDSAEWWAGTGAKEKKPEPTVLPEPEHWRFHFPDSLQVKNNTPWPQIDASTQQWIIDHMPNKANTA